MYYQNLCQRLRLDRKEIKKEIAKVLVEPPLSPPSEGNIRGKRLLLHLKGQKLPSFEGAEGDENNKRITTKNIIPINKK